MGVRNECNILRQRGYRVRIARIRRYRLTTTWPSLNDYRLKGGRLRARLKVAPRGCG
jgi:hypothetical protein